MRGQGPAGRLAVECAGLCLVMASHQYTFRVISGVRISSEKCIVTGFCL